MYSLATESRLFSVLLHSGIVALLWTRQRPVETATTLQQPLLVKSSPFSIDKAVGTY
jgi:hypothetical protein